MSAAKPQVKPKPLPRWFAAADRRRGELLLRKAAGTITPTESRELAVVTARIRSAIDIAYPRAADKLGDWARAAEATTRAVRRRPAVRVRREKAGDCNYAVVYDHRGTPTLLGRFPLLADARGYREHVLGLLGAGRAKGDVR